MHIQTAAAARRARNNPRGVHSLSCAVCGCAVSYGEVNVCVDLGEILSLLRGELEVLVLLLHLSNKSLVLNALL